MASVQFVVVALCVLVQPFVSAEPALCYECFGATCNDPFNVGVASQVSCQNLLIPQESEEFRAHSSSIASSNTGGLMSPLKNIYDKYPQLNAKDVKEYRCVKIVYSESNITYTARGCLPNQFFIVKDVCQFLDSVTDYTTCETCDTDLCNSANSARLSVIATILVLGVIYLFF